VYRYPAPGGPRPHAVVATSGDGRRFSYDANGNLLGDGPGRELVWSANNELLAVGQSGADGSFEFLGYGPEGELLSRLEIDSSATGSSTYVVQLGQLYEFATDLRTGRVERRNMIYADGALVAVHTTTSGGAAGTRYVHRDYLESTQALTDAAGGLVERISYDPHGEVRAQAIGADDPATLLRAVPRGFSGAVQLRKSQLVHLQGRVYDPRLGRFLSPDPAASAATDPRAQNGYAYARNNPLSLVDPTGLSAEAPLSAPDDGDSFLDAIGHAWQVISSAVGTVGSAVSGAVAVAASFLSSSWGGIRFSAIAAWNGIGWAGSQLASGAQKAWQIYNDDFNLGILPDRRVPFGLPQSIVLGFLQWKSQKLELWYVWKEGDQIAMRPYFGPLRANVSVNGQQTTLHRAAASALEKFDGQPCILAYNDTVNFVSDTVESALMKFAPSAASRQLADLLTSARAPVHIVGHSQGTLTAFWALHLADRRLDDVTVDFFGPATSSMSYAFALWWSGAKEGSYGYSAKENDPVATFVGGNFTGGLVLPLLLPGRVIFSAESIPLLPFPSVSPHSTYP
jgi:RHS repeat-associated protein